MKDSLLFLLAMFAGAWALQAQDTIENYDFLRPENVKQSGTEQPANVFRGSDEAAPVVIEREPEDIDPKEVWGPEVTAIIRGGISSVLFPVIEEEKAQVLLFSSFIREGQFIIKREGGTVQGDFDGKRLQLAGISREGVTVAVSGNIGETFHETEIEVPFPEFFTRNVVVRTD